MRVSKGDLVERVLIAEQAYADTEDRWIRTADDLLVWIMLVMGALGYVLRKLDFETAPIVLGVILAPMIEMALRQSLAMSDGRYAIFVTRPISATLLGVGLVLVLLALRPLVTRGLDWRARLALAEKGEEHP